MAQDLDIRSLGTALAGSHVMALAAIRDGRIALANPAFRAMFHTSGTILGTALLDIVAACDKKRLAAAVEAAAQSPVSFVGAGLSGDHPPFDLELCLERTLLDGEPMLLAFAADVTEQYRSRDRLAYLAYADPLTGLPNRTLLFDRLHHAMLAARRHNTEFAVLMADLDDFKPINDRFGHDAGDNVLQQVTQRFRGCLRECDTLARLGGDEFAVLLPHLATSQAAALVALRMIKALEEPIALGNQHVVVGTSVGIAGYPEHGGAIDYLLAAADTAMYQVKRSGKKQFQWAEPTYMGTSPQSVEQTWNASHAVDIAKIDEQHRHFAGLVDHLIEQLRNGAKRADVTTAMNEVIDYTPLHFTAEEKLMAEYDIAGTAQHREAHRRLMEDIRNLQIDSEMPNLGLVLRYLREWLIRHIDGLDRELGQALAARGCH